MNQTPTIQERVIHHILDASDEELSAADIKPETLLREELDLSSMQSITMVMDLEDEFQITVEDEELEGLRTVGDVMTLISSKQDGVTA